MLKALWEDWLWDFKRWPLEAGVFAGIVVLSVLLVAAVIVAAWVGGAAWSAVVTLGALFVFALGWGLAL